MSNNPLIDTLIALSGQDEVIVIHRAFVKFTGGLEPALLLNQLLYWTPKSRLTLDDKTGWIARSDQEWADELMLSQYAVRQARATLEKMDVLETTLRKFGGVPKVHYRLLMENMLTGWTDFLKTQSGLFENAKSTASDFAKTQSPLCENAETCIETTIETILIKSTDRELAADAACLSPSTQPLLFPEDPDQTTAFNGPYDALFQEALKAEARADGRRGPQKWGSMEQKRQFREAARKIGADALPHAIAEGLKRERKSRDALVVWLAAWANNLDKPKPTKPASTQYTGGPSLSREQARQWYG